MSLLLWGVALGAVAQTDVSSTLKLWCTDPIEVTNDGVTISKVKFYESDVETYCAFNMEIIVPEGLKIAKVKQGRDYVNDIQLSERGTSTHTISCGQPDSDLIRIICVTLDNATLYPDDEDGNPLDELFTIGFVAEPSLSPGTYELTVQDIKFVRPDVQAYVPEEPLKVQLTVRGTSTSVDEVIATPDGEMEYYDILGRKVKNPESGIFVTSKGEKVVVH